MAELSNYLEQTLLDSIFDNTAFTGSSTMYVALYTVTPTDTGGAGGTEVTGGAYARVRVYENNVTNTPGWASAAVTTTKYGVKNANTITFVTATAAWGDVKALAIFDDLTTGNMYFHGTLDVTKTVGDGDTFKITSNNLTLTLE